MLPPTPVNICIILGGNQIKLNLLITKNLPYVIHFFVDLKENKIQDVVFKHFEMVPRKQTFGQVKIS